LDYEDEDLEDEPDFEFFDTELDQQELFGGEQYTDDISEETENYKAPNWFWISFFYYSLSFWALINLFLLLFFIFCGIPENWLLSARIGASRNILLYKTLLHMTEQLYTPWGFETLPYGKFARIEYFNYFQPAYFKRTQKYYGTLVQTTPILLENPGTLEKFWGKKYHYTKFYGIPQGSSIFHSDSRYSTFETFLFRKKSKILVWNRMRLPQNIGELYINKEFFLKKEQQINDFYLIVDKQK